MWGNSGQHAFGMLPTWGSVIHTRIELAGSPNRYNTIESISIERPPTPRHASIAPTTPSAPVASSSNRPLLLSILQLDAQLVAQLLRLRARLLDLSVLVAHDGLKLHQPPAVHDGVLPEHAGHVV